MSDDLHYWLRLEEHPDGRLEWRDDEPEIMHPLKGRPQDTKCLVCGLPYAAHPQCPACGYTYCDCALLGDHRLCGKPDPARPNQAEQAKDRQGPRLVVCAAMLMLDDHIITGVRHYSPEMRETLRRAYGECYHKQVRMQGFVDQYGAFMNRLTAWTVAEAAGQIRCQVSTPGMLYSENLY